MPLLQTEEIHKRTDMILKNISEQFNPTLKSFLVAGRNYEKALAGVSVASKSYYDAMAKLGIIACDSASAKDLGESIRQIAETLRQIQLDYEELIKFLNSEVFYPLESKHDHDTRYMFGLQKKYQTDMRLRVEDIEKLQFTLKKVKRKNYNGKRSLKNDDKEKQDPYEMISDSISLKQKALDQYQHDTLRQAFIEERRRSCFFVEQQCEYAKRSIVYHKKAMESLTCQLQRWTESCADVKNLPQNATALLNMARPEDNSYYAIPDPPNEPAAQLNGNDYSTMPNRMHTPPNKQSVIPDGSQTLPKSNSVSSNMAANTSGHNVIPRENRKRVNAVFSHSVPNSPTQLSFEKGDVIILLIPQSRDGWHYGENDRTKQRGWFPFSYTKLVDQNNSHEKQQADPVTAQMPLPPADYETSEDPKLNGTGSADPSNGIDPYKLMKDNFLLGNPFANVQLRKTENGSANGFSSFK